MFRRRDEEENAELSANSQLKNTTTNFGNFMDNQTESFDKKETLGTGSARSIFGAPVARSSEPTQPVQTAQPAYVPQSLYSAQPVQPVQPAVAQQTLGASPSPFSPRTVSLSDAAPKVSTYKLTPSGALTAANAGTAAPQQPAAISTISRAQGASNMNGISNGGITNIDKIETEKRLTVGYGITLEGKISNCDKLIVYGAVNADLTDVKTLHISESGKFTGFADIENAEISGTFEGDLIVSNTITINQTGRMSGKVTYGSIEIKPGGKFTGQIIDAADAESLGKNKKAARKKAQDEAAALGQEEFTLSPEPLGFGMQQREEHFA